MSQLIPQVLELAIMLSVNCMSKFMQHGINHEAEGVESLAIMTAPQSEPDNTAVIFD
jgi:hypothetical protein